MFRGTTAKFTLNTTIPPNTYDDFVVTFAQGEKNDRKWVLKKNKGNSGVSYDEKKITVELTVAEANLFDSLKEYVEIQLWASISGKSFTHRPIIRSVYDILKDLPQEGVTT